MNRTQQPSADELNQQARKRKRSLLYLEQFPYPLDNDFRDDFNQRKILLYGITWKR